MKCPDWMELKWFNVEWLKYCYMFVMVGSLIDHHFLTALMSGILILIRIDRERIGRPKCKDQVRADEANH